MNLVDVTVVLVAVVAAVGGWRLGFVTRVFSWVGLVVGFLVSIAALPWVLGEVAAGQQALTVAVAVGTVFGACMLGQALGMVIGLRLRPVDREHGGITRIDGSAGALAGVVGTLAVLWLLLPVLAGSTGTIARHVSTSNVARALDQHLPDPPGTVQTLRAYVGDGVFPQVFEGLQRTPDLGPPPAETGLAPEVADRVRASVVRVGGVACDFSQTGSGFVVEEDLVMTNAHVVAGQDSTEVWRDDGVAHQAAVVAFDSRRDLALLSVPGLDRPPLVLATADADSQGAVFGHPGGQPLRIAPARVSRRIDARGRDIYGRAGAQRRVLELAASLRQGDSGAPVVDPTGQVVGVVFAIATDREGVAYALDRPELDALLEGPRDPATSAGACIR